MPAFRRVFDTQAGPSALGILVPPGTRTLVILRPRALTWDLLPARSETGSRLLFCDFGRDEAARVARQVSSALENNALTGRHPLEVTPRGNATGFWVWANVADLHWVVCPRVPGKPYQPSFFATRDDAQNTLMSLASTLCPPADADQEYYFNTQNFAGHEREVGFPT